MTSDLGFRPGSRWCPGVSGNRVQPWCRDMGINRVV